MSTVQESSAESPTVPAMYTSPAPPFISEEPVHTRSSSAPGDYVPRIGAHSRVHSRAPSESKLRTTWMSRHADSHTQAVKGLGLTLAPDSLTPRQPRKQGSSRPKPNLRINVDHEDRPPPPPPKSPRHSRDPSTASVQSAVSSMHGESPDSATVITPGSIAKSALLDTRGDPIPTPMPMQAEQGAYFPSGGQIRVREVSISKDRSKQNEPAPLAPPDPSRDKPVQAKRAGPNVDKPMPSLPTPSKRFSAHIREVREAEASQVGKEKEKETAPPNNAQSSAPIDIAALSKPSSDPVELKSNDLTTKPASQALKDKPMTETRDIRSPTPDTTPRPTRDIRSPTPDIANRPQSPANLLQTVSNTSKTLPVLPNDGPPRSRSATPDSSFALLRPPEPKSLREDPVQTLQDLSKQCEALHARYASLRAERVKLSTAISASLKDEKSGPDYANSLLDQHLALNAINSSMDICFAKLKSLDCRKEEAMASFMRQAKTKTMMDDARKAESAKTLLVPPSQSESGRSTPEVGTESKSSTPDVRTNSKSSTPELVPTSKFARVRPPTPEPEPVTDEPSKPEASEHQKETAEPEKRVTIIRTVSTHSKATTASSDAPPVSPMSSIHDMYATKRIRIKGIKAAKILGLVAQSANGSSDTKGITLPDASPPMPANLKKPIAVEVEIQRKASKEKKAASTTPKSPPSDHKMPKRKPPPPPRHDTKDSVSSLAASSHTESSPEEPEVTTPTGSQEVPFGLKSAKRGMLQTIQVFVDDDILDYYKNGAQ